MAITQPLGDLLIFLHIPKAGGTTVREVIGRAYPGDTYLDLRNDRQIDADLQALTGPQRDRLRAVAGHVSFGVHHHFEQPASYFTMLRHPVERLVSHYHYVRRNPRHFLHAAVVGGDLSLLQYVQSDLSEELANDQTRRLAGVAASRPITADDLAVAQAHLAQHFCVVGAAERFDESLLLLSRARGWRPPYYVSRNVGASEAAPIPLEVSAAILERNELDWQLVTAAREQLDWAIDATGPQFAAELARFRRDNRRYQRWRGAAESLLRPLRAAARG